MSRNSKKVLIDNLYNDIKERLQYEISQQECLRYKISRVNTSGLDYDQVIELLDEDRHEIINGNLPIYYDDMASLLSENNNFESVDNECLLPENPSVWDIITMSVYEFLDGKYHELCEQAIEELLPELED